MKRLMTRVKTLRQALGLSQEAFAERAGLKCKHYQSVEAGRKSDIHFATVEKLAKACRMELYELLNFDSPAAVLAEDPAEKALKATPGKGVRKSSKGSSGKGSRD